MGQRKKNPGVPQVSELVKPTLQALIQLGVRQHSRN